MALKPKADVIIPTQRTDILKKLKNKNWLCCRDFLHYTHEVLTSRLGTGHADTSKWEWCTNQHRDSYASYMGHTDMISFFSLVENEARARVKFNLMEKMLQPCGPPPERPED